MLTDQRSPSTPLVTSEFPRHRNGLGKVVGHRPDSTPTAVRAAGLQGDVVWRSLTSRAITFVTHLTTGRRHILCGLLNAFLDRDPVETWVITYR